MLNLFKDIYKSAPKRFRAILLLEILSSLTAGVGIVMLIPMLNALDISKEKSWLPDFVGELSSNTAIALLLLAYVLLVTLKAVMSKALSVRHTELVQGYTAELRRNFYKAVSEASWERFISHRSSEFLNLFVTETLRISYAATLMIKTVSLGIAALVNLIIAFTMSIPLTLIVTAFACVFRFVFRPVMKRSKEYGGKIRKSNEAFLDEIRSQMNGIKEIKSYGVEREQYEAFVSAAENYSKTNIEFTRLSSTPQMLLSIGAAVMIAAVFLLATRVFSVGIARIAVLVYIFGRLWPSFSSIQSYLQTLASTVPSYERLTAVTDELCGDIEAENADSNVQLPFERDIRLNRVGFKYESAEKPILDGISLMIKRGEIIAFAGRSGAGKSTLVDIILGFLLPTEGNVLIDGSKLDGTTVSAWRRSISYIPQEPLLLNETIRENIMRFHPDATDEELSKALEKAMARDFVEELPNGADTVIGDRGVRLSGGERQRIVLARALLGNPKLLILDEATSALDYESEKIISDCVCSLRGKMTVIVVAHRLSSIQTADRVFVVENGSITESGTFAELAANKDGYLGRMLELE